MDFNKIKLSPELLDTLDKIYTRLKKLHPRLTESVFIEKILAEWLKPYKHHQEPMYKKSEVELRNDIQNALDLSNKTQGQVAEEIEINRTYLGQVIRNEYDPSVTIALLLARATGQRVEDIFFLTPKE